jgi:hypothetical protein
MHACHPQTTWSDEGTGYQQPLFNRGNNAIERGGSGTDPGWLAEQATAAVRFADTHVAVVKFMPVNGR